LYPFTCLHDFYSCVRRIPETSLSPLLERSEAEDHSIPQNFTRLRSFISTSTSTSTSSLGHNRRAMVDLTGIKGPGDIDIGDEEGEGWTCAPFPNQ
jgi:hypothetical protein